MKTYETKTKKAEKKKKPKEKENQNQKRNRCLCHAWFRFSLACIHWTSALQVVFVEDGDSALSMLG
jgi:hypothetical protein